MAINQEFIKVVHADECMDVRDGTHDSPKFIEKGVPFVTSKNLVNGEIDFSTCSFISDEDHEAFSKRSNVEDGDILYAMIGTIGNPVIVKKDRDFSIKNVALFKFKNSDVYNRYIYHFLNSEIAKKQLAKLSKGGTQKFVSLGSLRKLKIPLPPLAEQRRIASILDQADELCQKRQQAIEKLDQLLQATFIDMFGDPEKNPKKWNKVVLGDICDPKDRVNYGVVQPGNEFEGGVPLIRVGDIDGGILSFHSIKRIDPEIEKDYSRSRIKGNEVLVSCVGSIGTIAKVPNKAIGFNIARAITRVPLQDKRIINFVAECLKTEAIQNYFKKNTRTVSQPTLNVSFVKETEIIFPNEEKILDFCKIVDRVEFEKELLQKALIMQESLFQSLQNQAFNGTL
ncbi:restriction endonuclease subunit S [Acinetobacter baumannii]|uniref:restriction endonuclease subunit S n=2 Tax=Acinetobacter baumannii TaxID=470 RepID=UPI003858888D